MSLAELSETVGILAALGHRARIPVRTPQNAGRLKRAAKSGAPSVPPSK
ncbi:MAG: hypothetical protein JSS02_09155 [Planctomycetes bacterium]|nr:hypothetical protein [Planctomycetota bacterium]